MFNTIVNSTIDLTQASKKQLVSTFVKHEAVADTLNKFLDVEAQYTKALFNNTMDTLTMFQSVVTNKDFVKEVSALYTPSFATPAKTTKAK